VHAISIMAVRVLVTGVERAGVRRERFMAETGLAASQLEDGLQRVPFGRFEHIVRAALAGSGDPALGLHMAEDRGRTGFDVLTPLVQGSLDLREALTKCLRYAAIATDGQHLELREDGDTATIVLPLLGGDAPELMFMAELAISGLWLRTVRHFVAGASQPSAACFTFAAPAHRAEYTRIFNGRERFSQPFTGLAFPRSWLDQRQLDHSAELSALLEGRAEQLLTRLDRAAPIAERVSSWLVAQDFKNRPSMDAAARPLGMSARSLRRRLQSEGAEFSVLVEQARARAAKRLLSAPHCTIQEVAYELGFTTPGAFARAFKRWTGLSPSAFRAQP
jgi:AraC-like DNA-binding protein